MGQPPRVVATAYAVEGKRQRVYEIRVKRPLPAAAQPADDPLIFVPSTLLGELKSPFQTRHSRAPVSWPQRSTRRFERTSAGDTEQTPDVQSHG